MRGMHAWCFFVGGVACFSAFWLWAKRTIPPFVFDKEIVQLLLLLLLLLPFFQLLIPPLSFGNTVMAASILQPGTGST